MSQKIWYRILIVIVIIPVFSSFITSTNHLETLAMPIAGLTERVSIASSGAQGNNSSYYPSISSDGRFVAFYSQASNLIAEDTNGIMSDIFVHDRLNRETEIVSKSSSGEQANDFSHRNTISANGRYVAFNSDATNLVIGDTNGYTDTFVHDRQTGETERVSVSSEGEQANNDTWYFISISANGRFVTFRSSATNLVSGDTNNRADIFVRDRQNGVTERVSISSSGAQNNYGVLYHASISGDGRYVAFDSTSSNLIADDKNGLADIFVHDRQTRVTELISVSSNGEQGNSNSVNPSISADGRYIVYLSESTNLVDGDTNGFKDAFVYDRISGITENVSVSSSREQANNESKEYPYISGDGRFVVYYSIASNLVAGDTNGYRDVFVHDRLTGETMRVSESSNGVQGNNDSYPYSLLSENGQFVAFNSSASNLVSGDTNERDDIFVHEIEGSIPPPVAIDLDVSTSSITLQYEGSSDLYNTKKKQPNQVVLKAEVSNHGTEDANDVTLKLWDGHPSNGVLLSSTENLSVNSGVTKSTTIEWIVLESGKQADLFLEVISGTSQPDQYLRNNMSSGGTPAYVAFADFEFIPDTFSFPNWKMTDSDFFRVIYKYLIEGISPSLMNLIRTSIGAYIYKDYAESGHCGGMSQTSIIYWDTPSEKPINKPTYEMSKTDAIDDIQDQHVRQLIYIESQSILKKINPMIFSPTNAYHFVKNSLSSTNPKPTILHLWGCCTQEGEEISHIVVADKVVEISGKKNIFIYDNADELTNIFIDEPTNILTLNEDKNELNYAHGTLSATLPKAYAYAPIRNASEITQEMIEDIIDAIFKSLHNDDFIQLFFNWNLAYQKEFQAANMIDAPSNFYVEDNLGHKTGILNGASINGIPGVVFEEWDTSFYFILPAGMEYKLFMNGNGLTSNTLSLAVPKSGYTVEALIFEKFEIPDGINANLDIQRDINDWRITFNDDTPDITPTTDEVFELREYIYLPFAINK